jgi:two-component system phosphate regulon response regulator PhoB
MSSPPTRSIPPSGKRVLLAVEDDVSADLLAHRLSRRGLQPARAEHGGAAVTQLGRTRFDLVVIETRLPGLTGLELLRRVPTDDIVGRPLIVLLGQQGNDEEIVRAFELGAAEYIARPFSPAVALARILRFLGAGSELVSRTPAAAGLLLVSPWLPDAAGPLGLMVLLTALLLSGAVLLALTATLLHAHATLREHRRARLEATWRPLLLRVLAGDAPPDALVDRVSPSRERLFLSFLVPYAARFEGRARSLISRLAAPFLARLEADLDRRRPGTRARAVQLLGLLGDASCRAPLRRCLDDPSPLVTYTAFRWLSRRGDSEDASALLGRIDRLSGVSTTQLSSSLVHLGAEAAPTLRSALADETASPTVRVVCAETLRWMGDGEAAPLAAQLLADEPEPELTAALLRLLRRVGCPEHALLVRSYCDSDIPFVRIHAARALGQIGDPDHDRTRLRRLVTGARSRWVAYNAAKSLTELGRPAPLHHLSQSPHARADLADSVLNEPPR